MQPNYVAMVVSGVSELKPFAPWIVLLVSLAIIGKALEISATRHGRRYRRQRGAARYRHGSVFSLEPGHAPEVTKMQSSADQLRTVMQADFQPRRLLSRSEARLQAGD